MLDSDDDVSMSVNAELRPTNKKMGTKRAAPASVSRPKRAKAVARTYKGDDDDDDDDDGSAADGSDYVEEVEPPPESSRRSSAFSSRRRAR